VRNPRIFLMDEPLSNLDAKLREALRVKLQHLQKTEHSTTLFVTHDQIEAMSMGDRIVVMRDGVVQQVDTPLSIYKKPANKFVAGFIGSPTMNFLQGSFNGDTTFRQDGTSVALPIPREISDRLRAKAGQELVLGIRPEHIYTRKPAGVDSVIPFQAQIEVIEPVGNETFVYFSTGANTQFVARVSTDAPPEVGSTAELLMDTSRIHFFDRATEQAC
jgi:multiple sugar transport system ATP-binding protein